MPEILPSFLTQTDTRYLSEETHQRRKAASFGEVSGRSEQVGDKFDRRFLWIKPESTSYARAIISWSFGSINLFGEVATENPTNMSLSYDVFEKTRFEDA